MDEFSRTHFEEDSRAYHVPLILILMNCYPKSLELTGTSWAKTHAFQNMPYFIFCTKQKTLNSQTYFPLLLYNCVTKGCLELAVCFGQKVSARGIFQQQHIFSVYDINALSLQFQRYLDRCVYFSDFSWRRLMQCVLSFLDHMSLHYILVYLY